MLKAKSAHQILITQTKQCDPTNFVLKRFLCITPPSAIRHNGIEMIPIVDHPRVQISIPKVFMQGSRSLEKSWRMVFVFQAWNSNGIC